MTRTIPHAALRVVFVTDGRGDEARVVSLVEHALRGGCRAVQLREPSWSASQMAACAARLRPLVRAVDGLLLANDRCDLAACGLCDGAQVGVRSLPPALARRAVGDGALLGVSCHDEAELARAKSAAADFALLSPVWPTGSKPGHAGLGVVRAGALTAGAGLPVVWLGGVASTRAADAAALPPAHRPSGVAVMSAIADAVDPAGAVREILRAWSSVFRADDVGFRLD